MRFPILTFLFVMTAPPVWGATACPFSADKRTFDGDAVTQARCLLRRVKPWAELDATPPSLPAPLQSRVGEEPAIDRALLAQYLRSRNITEAQVGGPLDGKLSYAPTETNSSEYGALYFAIHDTSSPNVKKAPFPPDINLASWKDGRLSKYDKGAKSVAHAFVSRTGESIAPVAFHTPLRATKFEGKHRHADDYIMRGRFIHIELVQPRRSRKATGEDDAQGPEPGFTPAQYERLALIYVVASARANRWLIPAFHAAIDAGIKGAHDDPQNFILADWAAAVERIASSVSSE